MPGFCGFLLIQPSSLEVQSTSRLEWIKRKHDLLFQHQLQLATWKVLGVSTLQQDFQRTYSCRMEWGHKYHLPVCLEKVVYVADALKGKLISFHVTSNHFWNFWLVSMRKVCSMLPLTPSDQQGHVHSWHSVHSWSELRHDISSLPFR